MGENMLRIKTFIKKTKKGGVLKVVREHYLRDDIYCGSEICSQCRQEKTVLQRTAPSLSSLVSQSHYIIPDTNVVLHQMDILEDIAIKNVIILQTVIQEVKHRSVPAYKKLKDVLSNSSKYFYVFTNEHHKDTYVEREPGETSNDRNDRAIRLAAQWYQQHLSNAQQHMEVILLTDDAENKAKARQMNIVSFTVSEYVKSIEAYPDLVDRLAKCNVDGPSEGDGKFKFPEHLPLSAVQRGIKSGRFLQGKYQASRENYLEATVYLTSGNDDESANTVFLQGYESLNRAVNDDIVAIEMLPESKWTCPSSLILEDSEEKEDTEIDNQEDVVKPAKKTVSPKQPTGRVVGIIKRNWRQYCGILQSSIIKQATRHLFVPAERRIPKVRIETRQAASLQGQRIVVAIDSWPRNSRYPHGHFVKRLGEIGDKVIENEVLLLEHDVPHCKFSEAVLSFLPKLPWSITEEDEKKRRDLRHIDVCSVDPPGCTDIDDALHCHKLDNGNFEVGVHIADVSHFIRPGNALDQEAASRGTTVYLTDQRIDMVPELLSSNLCSLRSEVDRFAFSVLWEVTEDADVVDVKFMKSIIKSRASFTYAEAQMAIDDKKRKDKIAKSLRHLNRLAKILKQRRTDQGALTLASPEIRFYIDSETHDPIDVETKQLRDTNSMVEEFMLLANTTVANKIHQEFPDCALLRRHPAPPASNFDPVVQVAQAKGFAMNVNTGKLLADSLNKAVIKKHAYFNTMLRILTTRCMMQALYFSSGTLPYEDYVHYGLASPIYTHFTSPIRRYSDIIVHRLLAVAINADTSYPQLLDKRKTQALCNNLNYRHKMGQYAGRASVALHTQIFFKDKILDEEGYILFVRKNALQVLIPRYGLEGTIYLRDNKTSQGPFSFREEDGSQTAEKVVLHVFDKVIVQISIDKSNIQHQKLQLKLVEPVVPGFSVTPAQKNGQVLQSAGVEQPPKKKSKTK